jgi:hypothetical protein
VAARARDNGPVRRRHRDHYLVRLRPLDLGWLKDATGFYTAGLLAMAALFAASLKFVIREE